MLRFVALFGLALSVGTAGAVPVSMGASMYDQAWELSWDMQAHPGVLENGILDDDDLRWQQPLWRGAIRAESEYGTADSSTYGALHRRQVGSDDQFTFDVTLDLLVAAQTSSDVPVTGYALAEMRLWVAAFAFDVSETVVYTGSHNLWLQSEEQRQLNLPLPYSAQYREGPGFASGSILTPGRYFTAFSRDALVAHATPGESINLTSHDAYSYDFERVPEPTTGVLMLIGLASIGWKGRNRARSCKSWLGFT